MVIYKKQEDLKEDGFEKANQWGERKMKYEIKNAKKLIPILLEENNQCGKF